MAITGNYQDSANYYPLFPAHPLFPAITGYYRVLPCISGCYPPLPTNLTGYWQDKEDTGDSMLKAGYGQTALQDHTPGPRTSTDGKPCRKHPLPAIRDFYPLPLLPRYYPLLAAITY